MIFRYILDLFLLIFKKCKYQRKNYFSNLLIRFRKQKKNNKNNNSLNFNNWINTFETYDKFVVLGSGPSLNNLIKKEKNTLYITTNSSVCKVFDSDFVYFTFTREYINTFLLYGFKTNRWKGTIFLFNKSKANHKIRMCSYNRVRKRFLNKNNFYNEFLLSDINNDDIFYSNYKIINDFSARFLKVEYDNINSGISIFIFGLYLANKFNKPIELYGLDAGMGGLEYSENKYDIPGKEVSEEHSVGTLKKIFNAIDNLKINFTNNTFFKF